MILLLQVVSILSFSIVLSISDFGVSADAL